MSEPLKIHAEILMLTVLALGWRLGALARCDALTNGMNAVMKDTPQSSLRPPSGEETVRNLQPEREPSPGEAGILISDVQLPELLEIMSRVYQPPSLCFFGTAAWLD